MLRAMRIWEVSTAALFGLAVIAKALEPTETIRALGQLGIGVQGAYGVLSTVVLAEIVVISRLISRPGESRTHFAAFVVLAAFTCYRVLTSWIVPKPAGCGCGSLLSLGAVDARSELNAGIFRNLSFMVAFLMTRLIDGIRLKPGEPGRCL